MTHLEIIKEMQLLSIAIRKGGNDTISNRLRHAYLRGVLYTIEASIGNLANRKINP